MNAMTQNIRVAVAGSGNVASHLARAIAGLENYSLLAVASRNVSHAAALAPELKCEAVAYSGITAFRPDIIIVSVADNALDDVVRQIGPDPGAVAALTSGTVVKEQLRLISCHCGVLYPLQTFTKGVDVNLREVPFFIEGSDECAVAALDALARALADNVYYADGERRGKLHVAGVLTNNFVNILLEQAGRFLAAEGLPLSVVGPLARATVEKALAVGPHAAQTGPARRHDMAVIEHQQQLLPPELLPAYKELTKLILDSHK